MLFGKLGGKRAEFECKPYGECLSNISVTHSPRYQIDMYLDPSQSIFSKMQTSYDEFCKKSDKEKVQMVRYYYKQEAVKNNRLEMPWWIDTDNNRPQRVNIVLFNSLSLEERSWLKARAFILYPEVFASQFENVALWMMSRWGVLCHNVRDMFTAGGKVYTLDDESLPGIFKKLFEVRKYIYYLLMNPDNELLCDLEDNSTLSIYACNSLLEQWIIKVNSIEKHCDISKILFWE